MILIAAVGSMHGNQVMGTKSSRSKQRAAELQLGLGGSYRVSIVSIHNRYEGAGGRPERQRGVPSSTARAALLPDDVYYRFTEVGHTWKYCTSFIASGKG